MVKQHGKYNTDATTQQRVNPTQVNANIAAVLKTGMPGDLGPWAMKERCLPDDSTASEAPNLLQYMSVLQPMVLKFRSLAKSPCF
jgi:hypothetical protein